MSLLAFLGNLFILKAYLFLKAIVLGIPYTNKLNIIYNYKNII